MRLLLANALLLGALIWATLVDVGDPVGGGHAEPVLPPSVLVESEVAEPELDGIMAYDSELDSAENEQAVTEELAPEVAAVPETVLEPTPEPVTELTPEPAAEPTPDRAMAESPAPATAPTPAIDRPALQREFARAPVPEQAESVEAPARPAAIPNRAALEDLAAELEAVFFERLP